MWYENWSFDPLKYLTNQNYLLHGTFWLTFLFVRYSLNNIQVGDDKSSGETYEELDNDHLDGLMLAHKQGNYGFLVWPAL